jgi:methionine aminopeptidase
VLSHCEPGASIYALCKAGDDLIAAQLNAASAEALGLSEAQIAAAGSVEGARAALKRGSSFPVCVSVNEMFGFVSPSSDCADVLKAGDLVKVELGVHIDGYPAIVGETRVVGEPPADEARMQALAAVSNAAYIAAHCIMRMLRPGVKNTDITYLVGHVADHFGVKTIKNLLSYEIKRYVSDGRNQIQMSHPKPGDEAPESGVFEIMPGQSFCIDVRFSSGTGLVKQGTESTQVFKRRVDQFSQMRTEMGAKAYRDVNQHFPTFHFALRQLKDQQTAKAGVRQMFEHHMVEPFETLRDKSKHALIACARFSAMVLDQRTVITTPLPLPVLDGIALPLGVPELLARDAEAHEAFSPMSVLPKPVEDMAED